MQFLIESELANRWRISRGTLANWRSAGTGPPYLKINGNGRILYSLAEVEKWEAANLRGAA